MVSTVLTPSRTEDATVVARAEEAVAAAADHLALAASRPDAACVRTSAGRFEPTPRSSESRSTN